MFKLLNRSCIMGLYDPNGSKDIGLLLQSRRLILDHFWYKLSDLPKYKKNRTPSPFYKYQLTLSQKTQLLYFMQITQPSNKNFYLQIIDPQFNVITLLKKKDLLDQEIDLDMQALTIQLIKYIFNHELMIVLKIYNIAYRIFFIDNIYAYINNYFLFNYKIRTSFIVLKPNYFFIKINKKKIKSIKKSKKKLLYKTYGFLIKTYGF